MTRKILNIVCVLVLLVCAMVLANQVFGSEVMLDSAVGEEVPFASDFTFDGGESEEEWLYNWEQALAMGGVSDFDVMSAGEDAFEFGFGDFSWDAGWDMVGQDLSAI